VEARLPADSDTIEDLALMPDGRIAVTGGLFKDSSVYVSRYRADGSPDPSFGEHGTWALSGAINTRLNTIVRLDNGKLVAAGAVLDGSDLFAVRLLDDGTLDSEFGEGGQAIVDCGAWRYAYDLKTTPEGKILVTGYSEDALLLARLNSNGSLDDEFAGGGCVRFPDYSRALFMHLTASGQIVLATTKDSALVVLKLEADGTVDTTFGSGQSGEVRDEVRVGTEWVTGIATDGQGRILVAGNAQDSLLDLFVVRFSASGEADSQFNARAIHSIFADSDWPRAGLAIDREGRIVLGGDAWASGGPRLFVMRLLPTGALDTSFGENGVTLLDSPPFSSAEALALENNGRILLGGFSMDIADGSSASRGALVRFR
jgi:uncharacterized delta-60 repeat protein